MDKITAVIGDYQGFLQTIIQKVADAGFDLNDFVQLDHMGYRTTLLEQYEQKKRQVADYGTHLGETIVNGRPISTYRLHQPVFSGKWRVDAVELIAPKEGKPMPEGLDHVEFVLYDDKDVFLQKYKNKAFVLDAAERGINPEIAYRLGDGLTVKFHLLNLPTVVYLEKKLGITEVKSAS
jgi:uncharacterized protein